MMLDVGVEEGGRRASLMPGPNIVKGHQDTLDRIVLPKFDGRFSNHSLQHALRLRNSGEAIRLFSKAFLGIKAARTPGCSAPEKFPSL
jgi:hypothetical protein